MCVCVCVCVCVCARLHACMVCGCFSLSLYLSLSLSTSLPLSLSPSLSDIACDVGELKRTVDADGHAHVIASKKGGQAPDGPILRRNNPQLI